MKKILSAIMVAVLIIGLFGCTVPDGAILDVKGSLEYTGNNTNVPKNAQDDKITGELADFSSNTLDGKSFSSDYFADYDVTVINVWATWCQPCVNELESFEMLNNNYRDKNVSCIGILFDSEDDGAISQALTILSGKGVTYTQLQLSDSIKQLLVDPYNLSSLPTTFFVDGNGNIISYVTGASSYAGWSTKLDGILG